MDRINITQQSIDQSELERLRLELSHLKACKEFESNLQDEIINFGAKYVRTTEGSTYSVTDAWLAIQRRIKEIDGAK